MAYTIHTGTLARWITITPTLIALIAIIGTLAGYLVGAAPKSALDMVQWALPAGMLLSMALLAFEPKVVGALNSLVNEEGGAV